MTEELKPCRLCGIEKPLDQFYKSGSGRYRSDCKDCNKEQSRLYWLNNKDRLSEKNKKWEENNRDKRRGYKRKPTDPVKVRARKMTNLAILRGDLIRADNCSSCGKPCSTEAHHEDYDKPFDVTWLCKGCHIELHRPLKNYITRHASGEEVWEESEERDE